MILCDRCYREAMPTAREAIALYQQSLQISESIGNIQLNNRILQQNKMLMMKIKNIIAPSSLVGEGVGGGVLTSFLR